MDSKIQEKLYSILCQMDIPVYDYVCPNAKFPYARIDSSYYMDGSTKDIDGIQLIQYVQLFDDYQGKKQIRQLANQMNDLVLNGNWEDEEIQIFVEMEMTRYYSHTEKDGSGYYNQATMMYKFTIYNK